MARCIWSAEVVVISLPAQLSHHLAAEAGRWPEVMTHTYGSYTLQDLMLAASHLRTHITTMHEEVPSDPSEPRLEPAWLLSYWIRAFHISPLRTHRHHAQRHLVTEAHRH